MSGTTGEISADAGPKDLIPGDTEQLETLRARLLAFAGAFADAERQLGTVHEDEWQGTAAIDFRAAVKHIPDTLQKASEEFAAAGKALADYNDVLREAQGKVKAVIDDAAEARLASKKYQQSVDDYNAAVARGDNATALPDRPSETDPGATAMNDCVGRLNSLRRRVDQAADLAKKRLDAAAEAAPDEPGWFSKLLGGAENFGKGVYEGLEGIGGAVNTFFHGDQWGMALASAADSFIYGAQHPMEFAKSVVDWDTFTSEPARWAGRLLPDAALALVTAGGGTAATRGARAMDRIAERADKLRRDGKGREDVDSRLHDVCRTDGEKCKAGEPVDVATGEMSLTHTDLSLPGALPLVLERTHLSDYRSGGWFGPSWAATLDQHLEVDERGVVFAAVDGMRLAYPAPTAPHVPVLPAQGARWPLLWDGSEYRITDPRAGRALVFARHPATGWPLGAVEDRAGQRIDIEYDSLTDRPVAIRHSGYHLTIETHPELPRITALRLGDSLVAGYDYDECGNLVGVTNSSGQALRLTYDDEDRVTSWTDRNGTTFGYVYDRTGRVLRTLGPHGMWSGRFRYEPDRRRTTYTDSLGHATVYEYDERCKLLRTTDPLGSTTSQERTADGRHLAAVTDPLGHTTRYEHDPAGNLTTVRLPDGTSATAAYNELNLPVLLSRPGGATWQYTYDATGNRLTATDPTGATTRYRYDDAGHLTEVTDALGNTTRATNDPAGLPLSVTYPTGHTTTVTRDAFGRPVTLTDPFGNETSLSWTPEGKPAERVHPDGTRETWTWDGEGNLLSHTDQAGNTTAYTYTHFDLVASRTDPDGARFTFAYDTELRLTAVTSPGGLTWTYQYGPTGCLTSETDFNGRTLTYAHDPAGRLVARTNGAGEIQTYARDPLGRVVARGEARYAYAPSGHLAEMSSPDATVTYEYDAVGRVISETVDGRPTAYTYDALGRRTSRTTPSGHVSTWAYGPGDRPSSLATSTGHHLDFAYDPVGQEITRTVDAAASLAQTWDAVGRLTSQTLHGALDPAAAPVQQRTYHYRADGHLTELTEHTTGTRRFTLTPTGRVTSVTGAGWTERYAYDPTGNMAADSDGPWQSTGTLLHRADRTTYTYDAQGRLIRRTRRLLNGQRRTWTYTWNADDRLTQTVTPDGTRWSYAYDPTGRRISKTRLLPDGTPTDTLHFTWDATRLAEQTATATGTTTTWDYTPGTHRPVAQTTTTPDGPARFHAVITDLVGTPTELLTPAGEIAWHHRTTLWGAPLPVTTGPEGIDCPLRFPGQYADQETGLHYNNQRYYDPETARYISPDPLGLGAAPANYAYVKDPTAFTDPLGLYTCPQAEKGHPDPASQSGDIGVLADTIAAHGDIKNRGIPGVDDLDVPEHIENVMTQSPGVRLRDTPGGIPRWAWWDGDTGSIIIREGDKGTFFQPDDGYSYYLRQVNE